MKSTILLGLLLLLAGSCSEKESPMLCDYEDEYDVYMRSIDRWAANPTTATCEQFRDSGIVLLQKLKGCPGARDLEQTIEDSRNLDCSWYDELL